MHKHRSKTCLPAPLGFTSGLVLGTAIIGLTLFPTLVWAQDVILKKEDIQIIIEKGMQNGRMAPQVGSVVRFSGLSEEERIAFAPTPEILALVAMLDEPDFQNREQAMQRLLKAVPDEQHMYAILDQVELSLEQRSRLIRLVSHKLLSHPRGALGIQMNWRPASPDGPGAVLITGLIPDLPAEEVLEIGDLITKVDGNLLFSSLDLVKFVQNRPPGEPVILAVSRPLLDDQQEIQKDEAGKVILESLEISLLLGSTDILFAENTGQSPLDQERLSQVRAVTQHYESKVKPKLIQFLSDQEDPFRIPIPEFPNSFLDRHQDIRLLRNQVRLLERGAFEDTEALRRSWRLRLELLRDMATQPDLNEYDRTYRQRIAERFAELMPDEAAD